MKKLVFAVASIALAIAPPALAQTAKPCAAGYPNKSIRLVVPSAPGGGTDIIARLIGQGLTDAWGQTVVVDNRGGAGGTAGVTIVAKQAAPDGYTMLLGSVGHLSFAPAVRKNLAYDPMKDLTPISLAALKPPIPGPCPARGSTMTNGLFLLSTSMSRGGTMRTRA